MAKKVCKIFRTSGNRNVGSFDESKAEGISFRIKTGTGCDASEWYLYQAKFSGTLLKAGRGVRDLV